MGYDRLKTRLDQGEGPLLQLDLTPQEAGEIAYRAQYPGQRPVSAVALANLRALMERGRWAPLELLSIATDGENRLFLVDGQHRLKAQAGLRDPKHSISWAVRYLEGTPSDVYAELDTVARARPHAVRLAAMGVTLGDRMLGLASPAAAFLLQHASNRATDAGTILLTERDDFVLANVDTFRLVDELIPQINDDYAHGLYNPPVVALFFATLQLAGQEASKFWVNVFHAQNQGWQKVRNKVLLGRPDKAPTTFFSRLLAIAWNAARSGEKTQILSGMLEWKQWPDPLTVERTTLVLPRVRVPAAMKK